MNNKTKNGNKVENQLSVRKRKEPSILLVLQEVVNRGVTSDNVAVIEKMMALYERAQEREAEKAFTVAFNDLMQEIPKIMATETVPNRDGTIRYKYAPLQEIDKQLRPLALKHGFTYCFAEAPVQLDGKVSKVCVIQHIGGHKRSNTFTVRVSGPPGANNSQADASTHSYSKRGALCDGFGIIVEHDDDARMVGKPIGRALAEDLMQRIKALGDTVDEQAFLKFAGVAANDPATLENYELISMDRYDYLEEMLQKKEVGPQSGKKASSEKRDPETGEYMF